MSEMSPGVVGVVVPGEHHHPGGRWRLRTCLGASIPVALKAGGIRMSIMITWGWGLALKPVIIRVTPNVGEVASNAITQAAPMRHWS